MTLTQLFTNIANAIRSKKGTSGTIVAENFPQEIASIDTSNNVKATQTGNSMSINTTSGNFFQFAIEKVKDFDLINYTSASYMFYGCRQLTDITLKNTNNVINMANMFSTCKKLETAPMFDTSNATFLTSMFNNCTSLANVPVYDTSNVTSFSSMFNNCTALTDTSLDNILQMCINATSYTGNKTLNVLRLNSVPNITTRVPTLPHYQDFLDAGWTIGIS